MALAEGLSPLVSLMATLTLAPTGTRAGREPALIWNRLGHGASPKGFSRREMAGLRYSLPTRTPSRIMTISAPRPPAMDIITGLMTSAGLRSIAWAICVASVATRSFMTSEPGVLGWGNALGLRGRSPEGGK